MDLMLEHIGKGFFTMLLIAMPAVLTAASIGLVVGILQAVTQVQEQTIAAAPKVLGVFLVIILMGPFSTNTLMEYFKRAANIAFEIVPKDEVMVLSGEEFYQYKNELNEKNYYGEKTMDIDEMMRNAGKTPFAGAKYKESVQKPPRSSTAQPNLLEKEHIFSGGKD